MLHVEGDDHVERGIEPLWLSPAAERRRVDAHLRRVLALLRTTPPRRLSPSRQRARALHIDRLDAYRKRGVFPRNHRFPLARVPHFIDEAGTRCAVAHLVETTGGAELVREVARTRNNARVHALAALPELVEWLEESGLTLDEAAGIQPACCYSPAEACVCDATDYGGILEGTVTGNGEQLAVARVFGPPEGVSPGDVVQIAGGQGDGGSTAGATMFARYNGGEARELYRVIDGQIIIPDTYCSIATTVPGPIPLSTFEQALSGDCVETLTAYDRLWGAKPGGDCGPSSACSVRHGALVDGSGLAVALVVAAAGGLRWLRRRA
jgi:hypothetical protein